MVRLLDGPVGAADDSLVSSWSRFRLHAAVGSGGVGLVAAVGLAVAVPGPAGLAVALAWIGLGVLPLFVVALWLGRQCPDHPQAGRLLMLGTALAVGSAIVGIVRDVYRIAGPGPWLWWVNLIYQYTTVLTLIAAVSLLATYPDGVVERRWQRWLLVANWWQLAIPPLLLLASPNQVIMYPQLEPAPVVPSPFAVSWLAPLAGQLDAVTSYYLVAGLAMVVLFTRYLQAGAEQRRRMRLLTCTMVVGVALLAASGAMQVLGRPRNVVDAVDALFIPVMVMIPVSIVVGVRRHRLFDIDLVFRGSVVYGVLTLGITAVYIGLAVAPGLALGSQIPVELAVVLTIATAVAFQPLRRRLEAVADRWVFGARVNRYQLLTAFGANLEQTIELRELVPTLAETVRRGLAASWVRVTLPSASAAAGRPDGPAELTVPLQRRGQTVGEIECGPPTDRRPGGGYEAGDVELLTTLAGQAAAAVANVELTAQLAERLDDLARSRARIVAAQDAERRRIERDLHDGAQQHIVALIMNLRLARNQLGRGERSSDEVLDELQTDVKELLADLRELAHGIHPPVLSDRGLVAAVEARADRFPLDMVVRAEPALRERRLGADVEGAAYFTVCEALTNIVKHAGAHTAAVELSTANGHLNVVISDDGCGFAPTNGTGHGLTNLRDRVEALGGNLRVDGGSGSGTSVHAELPIGASNA